MLLLLLELLLLDQVMWSTQLICFIPYSLFPVDFVGLRVITHSGINVQTNWSLSRGTTLLGSLSPMFISHLKFFSSFYSGVQVSRFRFFDQHSIFSLFF